MKKLRRNTYNGKLYCFAMSTCNEMQATLYEGRLMNKLQNSVILLVYQI